MIRIYKNTDPAFKSPYILSVGKWVSFFNFHDTPISKAFDTVTSSNPLTIRWEIDYTTCEFLFELETIKDFQKLHPEFYI